VTLSRDHDRSTLRSRDDKALWIFPQRTRWAI